MVFAQLVLLFAVSASASPLSAPWTRDLVKKDVLAAIPRGWEKLDTPPPADHSLTMKIGLKQDKFDKLVEELYQVSDPNHERYGKHLTKGQVEELVAPHPSSLSVVDEWLLAHDIDLSTASRSPAKDWITITIPLSVAESMTGAKYEVFRNRDTGNHVVRTLEYSIPKRLVGHVDLVQPTTFFGFKKMGQHSHIEGHAAADADIFTFHDDAHPKVLATVPSSCSSTITPACLRALYNTVNYVPKSTSTNTLGVAGYLGQWANTADLQTFFKKYRTDAVGSTFSVELVNGGKNTQSTPGVEANLDIQYTSGISYPTKNIYYSTGGSPPFVKDSNTPTNTNEPYLDWLNYILAETTIPQTFTTSYGDDEQTVPLDYATSVCNLFAQLGARGSSLLFSSGDSGVGAGDCKTNDGKNTVKFQPTFPASCPFVTAVGGTYRVPETAVSFSQGGFSNYFAQPSYQTTAVATFLAAQGTTYSTYYNKTGRGFPDVAAQGQGFQVAIGGSFESVAGTSASSPTFAAVISLLNDYRISLGKPSLGFLNPWLYSTAKSGLNDITSGSNPGCGTNGFSAKAGWDPVTGLGTPDFVKLQAFV